MANSALRRVAQELGEKVEGTTEILGVEAVIYGISREDWQSVAQGFLIIIGLPDATVIEQTRGVFRLEFSDEYRWRVLIQGHYAAIEWRVQSLEVSTASLRKPLAISNR